MAMADMRAETHLRRTTIASVIDAELDRQAMAGAARLDIAAMAGAIDAALATGSSAGTPAEGKRPDELNATNDD